MAPDTSPALMALNRLSTSVPNGLIAGEFAELLSDADVFELVEEAELV